MWSINNATYKINDQQLLVECLVVYNLYSTQGNTTNAPSGMTFNGKLENRFMELNIRTFSIQNLWSCVLRAKWNSSEVHLDLKSLRGS